MRMAGALRGAWVHCFTGEKQIPLEQWSKWTYLAVFCSLSGVVDKKKSKKKKKKKSKDPAKKSHEFHHPVMKSNPPVLEI